MSYFLGFNGSFEWCLKCYSENFGLFLRSTKLILRALPEYYKDTLWIKLFARKQLCEKKVKNAVFFHFLKNFDQKSAFFLARAPLQN